MKSLLQQQIVEERQKRRGLGVDKLKPVLKQLSDRQRSIIFDPHRFKVAAAGRRAGKSHTVAAYMLYECLKNSGTHVLYLGLTRDSAKAAIWGLLIAMLEGCDIPHEARPSSLAIKFPNGSDVSLFGGDTPNARNRLRGRAFKLICADETGFFTGLDPLIHALLPTLADHAGTLVMTSSPGELLSGYFYDAFMGDNKADWRQWAWTMHDNPFFQGPALDPSKYKNRAEEEFDTIARLQYGGDKLHPAFVREYLGLYVQDNTSKVYPYTLRNIIPSATKLPREEYALGIDLGVSSECAIVVMKHSEYAREVQIVETWREKQILIDDFAAVLEDFQARYKPTVMVADTGGLGAAFVQELRRRYQMPIRAADKMDKVIYQKIFANDLISGYIKVVEGLHIIKEWDKIVKDPEGAEVKGQSNHESDAALYVYRYLYSTYLKTFTPIESEEQRMEREVTESALQSKRDMDEMREEESYVY